MIVISGLVQERHNEKVKNFSIQLEIDCHSRRLEKVSFFRKKKDSRAIQQQVWDNFDIFQISGNIAEALRRGSFTHVNEFLIDGVHIFKVSGRKKGKTLKEAVGLFTNESELRKRYKEFKYKTMRYEGEGVIECTVLVQRQHQLGKPPVTLKVKGSLDQKKCRAVIEYIQKSIKIKNLKTNLDS